MEQKILRSLLLSLMVQGSVNASYSSMYLNNLQYTLKRHPWNVMSWCLTAGLAYKSLNNTKTNDDSIVIGALSLMSIIRPLLSTNKSQSTEYVDIKKELEHAVEHTELSAVHYYLSQLESMPPDERLSYLKDLYNKATQQRLYLAKPILSLLSWRDMACGVLGVSFIKQFWKVKWHTLIYVEANPLFEQSTYWQWITSFSDASIGLFGIYAVYKGITAGSQQWRRDDAKAIQESIHTQIKQLLGHNPVAFADKESVGIL